MFCRRFFTFTLQTINAFEIKALKRKFNDILFSRKRELKTNVIYLVF